MRLLLLFPASIAFAILQVTLRTEDDTELIRRLKLREPKAIADLYERYGRAAYSLVLRMTHNPMAAEDLVQEVFLQIWNRLDGLQGGDLALGPWLLTLARNRAIDHLSSTDARLRATAAELGKREWPELYKAADVAELSASRTRRLRNILEKLDPDHRAAIELAYYEALSPAEIATRLNQPPDTVKTWIRSALRILRDELQQVAGA